MKIIEYKEEYKDSTIKLVMSILQEELGYKDLKRPDLYNIRTIYQESGKGNFWLALIDDKVIGTIGLKDCGNNRGYLKRMFVEATYRNRGVGKKLLSKLIKFAKNSNYKKIYIGTVKELKSAINFYEKNGFKKINQLPKDLAAPGDDTFLELEL